MNDLQDIHDIGQTLIRYTLACDQRDWPLLDSVFLPDVIANYGGEYRLQGRDKLQRMIRNFLDHCGPTQHLLGNGRVTVDGDSATSACYVRAAHAGLGEKKSLVYEVWGEYCDELVRTGEGWRIRERKMKIFHETGPRDMLQRP